MTTSYLRFLAPCALAAAVLFTGCSEPEPTSAPMTDAGRPTADAEAGLDAPSRGDAATPTPTVCNDLTTTGLPVAKFRGTAEAPPPSIAGTIEDGTYVLVESPLYRQPAFPSIGDVSAKLVIAGTTVQSVTNPSPDHSVDDRTTTEIWALSGTTLHITRTCPPNAPPLSVELSVERPDGGGPLRLVVHGTSQGIETARVFERQ